MGGPRAAHFRFGRHVHGRCRHRPRRNAGPHRPDPGHDHVKVGLRRPTVDNRERDRGGRTRSRNHPCRRRTGQGRGATCARDGQDVLPAIGRRAAYRGEDGDRESAPGPFDAISFPPDVRRGFRDIGDSHGMPMAIIGSERMTEDGDRVGRAPKIPKAVHETGSRIDSARRGRKRIRSCPGLREPVPASSASARSRPRAGAGHR